MIFADNRRSLLRTMLGSALVIGLSLAAFTRAEDSPQPAAGRTTMAAPTTRPWADDPRGRQLEEMLNRRHADISFVGVPFADAMVKLGQLTGATIRVNWDALEAAGVERTVPVKARLRDSKFRKALDTILSDTGGDKVKLAYTIEDGAIFISTTNDIAGNHSTIRVYDVRDLMDAATARRLAEAPRPGREPRDIRAGLSREITDLILETVDRDSWIQNGGKFGKISFQNGQFIVTQIRENHLQVEALLDKLREAQAVQVSIEMRFIQLPRRQFASMVKDAGIVLDAEDKPNPQGELKAVPTTRPGVVVSDAKIKAMLASVLAAKDSTLLTAPRVTVFSGQAATVTVGSERAYIDRYRAGGPGEEEWVPVTATTQDGIHVEVQPTVSADRNVITVKMHPSVSEFRGMREEPWDKAPAGEKLMVQKPDMTVREVNSVVSIPDGQTLVLLLPQTAGKHVATQMVTLFTVRPAMIVQQQQQQSVPPGNP